MEYQKKGAAVKRPWLESASVDAPQNKKHNESVVYNISYPDFSMARKAFKAGTKCKTKAKPMLIQSTRGLLINAMGKRDHYVGDALPLDVRNQHITVASTQHHQATVDLPESVSECQ